MKNGWFGTVNGRATARADTKELQRLHVHQQLADFIIVSANNTNDLGIRDSDAGAS